jgi:hypothetical protein
MAARGFGDPGGVTDLRTVSIQSSNCGAMLVTSESPGGVGGPLAFHCVTYWHLVSHWLVLDLPINCGAHSSVARRAISTVDSCHSAQAWGVTPFPNLS